MRSFRITQRFLVPLSTVSARTAWHNDLWSVIQKRQNSQGGTARKIGRGCAARFLKLLPCFRQNLWFSLFRPEALEPGAWPERVTSCYGTYTVVGVNIKGEMVLSPNDEEVANSSKKHTQFKTWVHKPYPISDQNGRNWYPVSDQSGWKTTDTLWRRTYPYSLYTGDYPPGRKRVADYESHCLRKRD